MVPPELPLVVSNKRKAITLFCCNVQITSYLLRCCGEGGKAAFSGLWLLLKTAASNKPPPFSANRRLSQIAAALILRNLLVITNRRRFLQIAAPWKSPHPFGLMLGSVIPHPGECAPFSLGNALCEDPDGGTFLRLGIFLCSISISIALKGGNVKLFGSKEEKNIKINGEGFGTKEN